MTRKKKRKLKKNVERVLICSLCLLAILVSVYFIKNAKKWAGGMNSQPDDPTVTQAANNKPSGNTKNPTAEPTATPEPKIPIEAENKYTHQGTAKQEVVPGAKVSYVLNYPVFDNAIATEASMQNAKALLSKELETLPENAKSRIWIDYEDSGSKAVVSAVFHITKEVDGTTTESVSEWVYNKKKGESFEAKEMFGKLAYEYVVKRVTETVGITEGEDGLTAEQEHFPYFLLKEEEVEFFYLDGGKLGSISIPYREVYTYMAVTPDGTVRMDNIRELDPNKPMIALTFDDGPHINNTPRLLSILEKYNVRATFFVLGDRLSWEGSEEAMALMAASDNEIASHTFSHSNLTRLTDEQIEAEFVKTRNKIYEMTGEYPTFVRAPGGNVNDKVKALSYAPLINWSVDTRDWESRDRDSIVAQALAGAKANRIMLMHDIHTCTVDAAEILIPKLLEQGYQLVTLSELFYYNNVEPENGVLYRAADY